MHKSLCVIVTNAIYFLNHEWPNGQTESYETIAFFPLLPKSDFRASNQPSTVSPDGLQDLQQLLMTVAKVQQHITDFVVSVQWV